MENTNLKQFIKVLVENIDEVLVFETIEDRQFFIENFLSILVKSKSEEVNNNLKLFLEQNFHNNQEMYELSEGALKDTIAAIGKGIGSVIGGVVKGAGGLVGAFSRGLAGKSVSHDDHPFYRGYTQPYVKTVVGGGKKKKTPSGPPAPTHGDVHMMHIEDPSTGYGLIAPFVKDENGKVVRWAKEVDPSGDTHRGILPRPGTTTPLPAGFAHKRHFSEVGVSKVLNDFLNASKNGVSGGLLIKSDNPHGTQLPLKEPTP